MVGKPFDVSPVLKEARVGHLVRQCVFERVLEIRE
jgi:hypothetical protein